MTTIERPPLSTLSANTLHRAHSDLVKPTLPRLKTMVPQSSINTKTQTHRVTKPSSSSTTTAQHAQKLKYRLKLAYYKLRTDQASVPISEIIQNQESTTIMKKTNITTPSLTRHISLLAASTPLHSQFQPILPKKKVTFNRSSSHIESSSSSLTKQRNKIQSASSLARINEYPQMNNNTRLISSTPQLIRSRSLRIEDLVNVSSDKTLNDLNQQQQLEITPVRGRTDTNGDLILSSPTKKLYSSTPGSYGAAKSLLQLSIYN